jgi:hypothetical protein
MSIEIIEHWSAFQSGKMAFGLAAKEAVSNGLALIRVSFRLSYRLFEVDIFTLPLSSNERSLAANAPNRPVHASSHISPRILIVAS